jgi:hypothetical protein
VGGYAGITGTRLMFHTPVVIRATRALFQQFDDEIYPQNRGRHVQLKPIGASARPMGVFSGFYESHEPPPSGDASGIVPVHRRGQRPAKWAHFISLFCLLFPWQPLGRYGASIHLMAASSGFRSSPGHAELDDALLQCICVAIKVARN